MKLNNKGFAISTILYGLLIIIVLTTSVILGTMSFTRKNSKEFAEDVKKELEDIDLQAPSFLLTDVDMGIFDYYTGQEKPTVGMLTGDGIKKFCFNRENNENYFNEAVFEFTIRVCDRSGVNMLEDSWLPFSFYTSDESGTVTSNYDLSCGATNLVFDRENNVGNQKCSMYKQKCRANSHSIDNTNGQKLHLHVSIPDKLFEDDNHNQTEYQTIEYPNLCQINTNTTTETRCDVSYYGN